VPNYVLTYLGPDMAAGEITAVLVVYLSGVLYSLHLWPPPRPVRKAAVDVAGRRARAAAVKAGWVT